MHGERNQYARGTEKKLAAPHRHVLMNLLENVLWGKDEHSGFETLFPKKCKQQPIKQSWFRPLVKKMVGAMSGPWKLCQRTTAIVYRWFITCLSANINYARTEPIACNVCWAHFGSDMGFRGNGVSTFFRKILKPKHLQNNWLGIFGRKNPSYSRHFENIWSRFWQLSDPTGFSFLWH